MNYPWDVLGTEETNDKKVIKKAYAKLIRKYRPDEAPEKFQEINQAYQYALTLLKSNQADDDVVAVTPEYPKKNESEEVQTESPIDVADDVAEVESVVSEFTHTQEIDDVIEEVEEDDTELNLANDILEQFHQMAFAEYKRKKKAESWNFLNQYHEIQDLQLRDSLSKELFKRVAEYNFFQLKENKSLLLNQPMVRLVAEVLEWESQWQEFHQLFPEDYVQHVFSLLEMKGKQKEGEKFYNRPFGVFIEIIMTVIFIGIIYQPSFGLDKELLIIMAYILFNSFSSLSSISMSSMQYMLDFKLFDVYLNEPSLKSKIIRTLTYHVSMIPVYLSAYDAEYFVSLMFPVAAFLLIINVILWFKNKQLLHDWLSGTIMLK
ncbi:DnaJ domain-containing protein [Marinicella rhabdoformis]|uniref:DnaJ domain-containing protein n=1 Tax=Marinicella rhabdoformis TaxID=2580566 RepID=UPI0012AEDD65|nr:DnaJ domain-containing protein [Marinicella rhabdoformis]